MFLLQNGGGDGARTAQVHVHIGTPDTRLGFGKVVIWNQVVMRFASLMIILRPVLVLGRRLGLGGNVRESGSS